VATKISGIDLGRYKYKIYRNPYKGILDNVPSIVRATKGILKNENIPYFIEALSFAVKPAIHGHQVFFDYQKMPKHGEVLPFKFSCHCQT
jgi:hypothetical protein